MNMITTMADNTLERRQRGMVLVVSLIILVVITLLAISAMRVTTLEERMAGNTRDRQLAFQAAEYALREAQDYLSTAVLGTFSATGGSGGLFNSLNTAPNEDVYWMTTHDWTNTAKYISPTRTGTLLTGQAPPKYAIEEFPYVPCTSDSLKWPPPQPRSVYRVTARGSGRTTDADVMLQMWYDRGCSN